VADIVAITGAAGALGSEVARELVREGYRALLLDTLHSKERLVRLAAELGSACIATPMDVSSGEAWQVALAQVEKSFGGRPSHGVLIAGGWQGGKPFHSDNDEATWRAMLGMNLETAASSLRALLPAMVSNKRGSVVVIGSRVVERPWTSAGAAAYAVSKAAVVELAQVVAAEVLEYGVRVNAILPSTLDTAANRAAMPKADPSSWVSTASAAKVIAFFLSEGARDISGAAIPLYGRAP
jgi:NAD(P)-dependent dehydrogenase (short-subunit alcohol dehydrogenase family)